MRVQQLGDIHHRLSTPSFGSLNDGHFSLGPLVYGSTRCSFGLNKNINYICNVVFEYLKTSSCGAVIVPAT